MCFRTYMDWVLHDPEWGAYGSGRLRIGPQGDFVTSPSLGGEFAALLARQLLAWLQDTANGQPGPVSLVEAGPGEGTLALDLAKTVHQLAPDLRDRLEIVLVEPNHGMADRQRLLLAQSPLPVRWTTLAALAEAPLQGVLLAHEVLDALAVDRFQRQHEQWCQQRVSLVNDRLALVAADPLDASALKKLEALGLGPGSESRPEGWCSELHPGVAPWLQQAAAALSRGRLLVIDYALEAWRYYAPQRSNGTLMAYRDQVASADPFQAPGEWDLTAHLCIDSLQQDALSSGWVPIGQRRQGEALLALGLAQRLHGLQQEALLESALQKRESLLRLIDPAALGDFRWLAFRRNDPLDATRQPVEGIATADLFLHDPPLN